MYDDEITYRTKFMTRKEAIKEVGLIAFLKSRIVTPKQITETIKEYNLNLKEESLGSILWHTRYHTFKAIDGYDFY